MKDLNPAVMKAVETLDYRVTVGDVAANAGLDLNVAQQGMIALAANTQARAVYEALGFETVVLTMEKRL